MFFISLSSKTQPDRTFSLCSKEQSQIEHERRAVNFMYEAPPGMQKGLLMASCPFDMRLEKDADGEADRKLRLDEKFAFLKGAPRPEYDSHRTILCLCLVLIIHPFYFLLSPVCNRD